MPISLSGIDTGTPEYGIGSFMQFADRASQGTAADSDAMSDYLPHKYLVVSADIMANAPGIEIPIISDTPYEFPRQQGPLDIINGFVTPAYTERLDPLYRQLMNDRRALNPTTNALDATQIGYRQAAVGADAILDGGALTTTVGDLPSGINQPDATNTPIRLRLVPAAASTAVVTIVGTDYNDNRITDQVTFDSTTPQITNKYFNSITSIYASAAVASVDIGGSDDATHRRYISTFRNNDDATLLHGTDIYIQKGRVPNTYREVFFNGLSFSISREGSVDYAWSCIGRRPVSHTAPDGTTATPTSTAPVVEKEAFTGWQAGIFYTPPGGNATRLAGVEANITISNNLEFSPVLSGRRTPGLAFRRRLNFAFEGTMQYKSNDSNLINDVLGNEFLEDAYLELVNAGAGGFPKLVRYSFGRLQFINVPGGTLEDEGEIRRNMSMIALPKGTTPAVTITTHTLNPVQLAAIAA